jgi:hypothetical protein
MGTLQGSGKQRYLQLLDGALGALADNLATFGDDQELAAVRDFGRRERWDWRRLPRRAGTYRALSELVGRVRQEYHWFQWHASGPEPRHNRGYFDTIQLDASSGLPWAFDFIQLHHLQRDAPELLAKLPEYARLERDLRVLLTTDDVEIDRVGDRARELHRTAMRRSFLEQLRGSDLLGWKAGQTSLPPRARLVLDLGVEQLWNITLLRFMPDRAQFAAYVVDLWQDAREQLLSRGASGPVIADALQGAFCFSAENPAWYIIASLDERFPSVHPVHVSRGIIGPLFHNLGGGHAGADVLPATRRILAADPGAGVLHFTRQYSFAPLHELRDGEPRQIIYRQNWHDEVIVCPARHAARLARSMLGTQVRVVQV